MTQNHAKHCKDCGQGKPLSDFYRNNKTADGRQGVCKPCDYIRRFGHAPKPRMTRADKEAALHKLLAAYTAERDSFYDCSTDTEGEGLDPADAAELARMDKIIDDARMALGIEAPTKQADAMNAFLSGGT